MNGAVIHIGKIKRVSDDGYIIASVTESPMETPPLKALIGEYEVGDTVFYFLFENGFGAIIGNAE